MKKHNIFILILLVFALLVSCNNEPEHSCSYDSTTLACSCGNIKEGVVAYVGESYEKATARFLTLQAAADYAAAKPKAIGANTTIIKGVSNKEISCDGLSISGKDVAFDLSTNKVVFAQGKGISVSSSNATINIKNTSTGIVPIVVSDSTLDLGADISCSIELKDSSVLSLTSGNITVKGFSAETGSTITIDKGSSVSTDSQQIAQAIEDASTGGSDPTGVAVAYIGASYSEATATFTTLQEAADYVRTAQATAGKATAITVKGRNDLSFSCEELSIGDSNIVFDLSSSTVTTTVKLNLNRSEVSIKYGSSAKTLTCEVTMNQSNLDFTSGSFTVNSFGADSVSVISFSTAGIIKAKNTDTAKKMRKCIAGYITDGSSDIITVAGHYHSYNSTTLECACGRINSDVKLYVGSTYRDAAARFKYLSDAATYVKGKASSTTTVVGLPNVKITDSSLSVTDGNVIFDLSDCSLSSEISIYPKNSKIEIDLGSEADLAISSFSCTDSTYGTHTFATSSIKITAKSVTVSSVTAYKNLKKILTSDSTQDISIKNHTHVYDPDTGICECGDVITDYVAYIGTSFETAEDAKKFKTLQEAATYVKSQQTQNKKDSDAITVSGVQYKSISGQAVKVENSNVIFDLTGSYVSGGFGFDISDSHFEIDTNSNLNISSFAVSGNSTVTLNATKVTVNSVNEYKALMTVLTTGSTKNIEIKGHTHTFVTKYNAGQTKTWQECSVCGYCTEEKDVVPHWVSMFYLDMANLSALVDLEEIIEYVEIPENVTIYIITGGGASQGASYYNPYYKTSKSDSIFDIFGLFNKEYAYPNLVEALENGGDTDHEVSFSNSLKENSYQYWKYYLDSNGKGCFVELKDGPKLMSDGKTLKNFINFVYSKEKDRPQTHYILHLWNHGGGNMWGMLQDFTNSKKPIMSMKDMDDSVSATEFVATDKKMFDIIWFDMCEMQQIETLNMVKDYSKCMIGSENTTYASCLGAMYEYVNENPSANYIDVAKYFIDKTDEKQDFYDSRTWSVLDCDATNIATLNTEFGKLMNAMYNEVAKNGFTKVDNALKNSVDYYAYSSHDTSSYDIYSVAEKFGYDSTNLAKLKTAIDNVVKYNKYGEDVSGTSGIAFFFDVDLSSNISTYGQSNYDDYIKRANALYPKLPAPNQASCGLAKLTEAYLNRK